MLKFDFTDRKVIVAGGTRGIGAEISRGFLEAGAEVIALYGSDSAAAQALAASLGEATSRFSAVKCNVADYTQVDAFFQEYDKTHQWLDIMVNSAGIRKDAVMAMMPQENWNAVLDTNLGGTFNLFKLGVQRMLRRRYGRLIAVSSVAGRIGIEGQANYSAAKAGQSALVKSFGKEIARRGITANCVAPGFIDTNFIADLPDEQRSAYQASVPMRRFGNAKEVATAVLFLASEEASYITGATLDISGGL